MTLRDPGFHWHFWRVWQALGLLGKRIGRRTSHGLAPLEWQTSFGLSLISCTSSETSDSDICVSFGFLKSSQSFLSFGSGGIFFTWDFYSLLTSNEIWWVAVQDKDTVEFTHERAVLHNPPLFVEWHESYLHLITSHSACLMDCQSSGILWRVQNYRSLDFSHQLKHPVQDRWTGKIKHILFQLIMTSQLGREITSCFLTLIHCLRYFSHAKRLQISERNL